MRRRLLGTAGGIVLLLCVLCRYSYLLKIPWFMFSAFAAIKFNRLLFCVCLKIYFD